MDGKNMIGIFNLKKWIALLIVHNLPAFPWHKNHAMDYVANNYHVLWHLWLQSRALKVLGVEIAGFQEEVEHMVYLEKRRRTWSDPLLEQPGLEAFHASSAQLALHNKYKLKLVGVLSWANISLISHHKFSPCIMVYR